MKVICQREGLLQACQLASMVLPTRDIKPVLKNLKFTAEPGQATLFATDLELGLRVEVAGVTIMSPGVALLPATRVIQILREAKVAEMELEVSGQEVVLRGGSEAINSNLAIAKLIREAISANSLPEDAVGIIETTDRSAAMELMKMKQYIDCLIPRGGKGLIQTVVENSTIPVIEHGDGNCHMYVDASADLKMAQDLAFNAKVQNPSVCNAMETLLVSEQIAAEFLPTMCKRLAESGVEIRGCEKTAAIVQNARPATEEDWQTEYLDLILAVRVVGDLGEAISHISKYGSRHTEAIVTEDLTAARRFTTEVDAAAVFVNVSTRFTDGYEFGKGAEMGISTQKLHARGPMGIEEITTYKYVVTGSGQLRG